MKKDMTAQEIAHAAQIGSKVLAGLAKGRARLASINQQRKARSEQWAVQILYLARLDQQAGWPAHGRAGRICRKLHGQMTERLIRKYLARLSSRAESGAYSRGNLITGAHDG